MRAHEYLAELADKPYPFLIAQHGGDKSTFGFDTDNESEYIVKIVPFTVGQTFQNNALDVSFALVKNGRYVDTATGEAGQAALRVFGTVVEATKQTIFKRSEQGLNIEYIQFKSKDSEPKRVALYERFAKNIARYMPGWQFDSRVSDDGLTAFRVKRKDISKVDEVEELDYVSKSKRQGFSGPRNVETLRKSYGVKELLDLGDFSIWHGSRNYNSIYYIVDNQSREAQIQLMCHERKNVLTDLSLFAAPNNTIKAADFYRILITKLNKVLVASSQSPGSQAVWAKLNKFPDVDIHGWLNGKPVNIDTRDREYAYGTAPRQTLRMHPTNGTMRRVSTDSPENRDARNMKLVAHKKDALEEDWRNWVAGLGAASMLAGGGGAAYDAYQASQQAQEPTAQVQQVGKQKAPQITQQHIELAKDLLSSTPAQLLIKVATAAGIKGAELTQFLAQTAHESANFSTTKEFGDKNYFKKYDIKYNPAKAKELGNLRPGEGERYKGRGFIQLTGKYNYEKAGEALGLDLVKHPELAERPDVAAKIAVWFWKNRVQPKVDNFNNTVDATKPINPALKGLQDRHIKFQSMKQALAKPAAPTTLAKAATQAPAAKPVAKPVPKPQAKPVTKIASKPAPVKGKKV